MNKNQIKFFVGVGILLIATTGWLYFNNQVVKNEVDTASQPTTKQLMRNSREMRNAEIRKEALLAEKRLMQKKADRYSGNTDYKKDERNAQWNIEDRRQQLEQALSTMKDAPAVAGSIKADLQRQLNNLDTGQH